MIDLISTHEGVEEETKSAAHLVAGVIAIAIKDLCVVPTKDELVNRCNLNRHAVGSLKFFFSKSSMFIVYANLIGIDANIFVKALEKRRFEENAQKRTKIPYLTHADVKSIRTRINWWQNSPVQSNQLEFEFCEAA